MTASTAPIAALAAAFVAAPAFAVPVTFDDFVGNDGTFLEGQTSGTDTVDGVTLTAAITGTGTFDGTGGGTGIGNAGETTATGNNQFQVNTGETFTLSFDTAGTLTGFTVGLFPTTSTITIANGVDTSVATLTNSGTGFVQPVSAAFSLGFEAGDVLTVSTATTGGGGNTGLSTGYRLQSITIDAIPEPASLAFLGAGGMLMLGRRRSA